MWLYTVIGFFSVVEKPLDGQADVGYLMVRARAEGDLDALREKYLPELTSTIATPEGDYKFRATISHDDFARGLARLAGDIHYGNFKNEVAHRQGSARAHAYMDVWSASLQLNHLKRAKR